MKAKPIYEIRLPNSVSLKKEEYDGIVDHLREQMPDYHVILFVGDVNTTVKREPKWYQFWK